MLVKTRKYLIVTFVTLFISCGLTNTPKTIEYGKSRNFDNNILKGVLLDEVDFAQTYKGKDSTFDNLVLKGNFGEFFFQKRNGDISRFFYEQSRKSFILTYEPDKIQRLPFSWDYINGLVIGQNKDNIFYSNPSSRNTVFYRCNLISKECKDFEIPNFTIISVLERNTAPNVLFLYGVLGEGNNRKLGFYTFDLKTQSLNPSYELKLNHIPDGDPGIYGGSFYDINDKIFYVFEDKNQILQFDKNLNFISCLQTPDNFQFKSDDPKQYNPKNQAFYKDLIIKDNFLYVLLNMVNSDKKYFYIDRFDLTSGIYERTYKIFVDFDKDLYANGKLKSQSSNGSIIFFLPKKNNDALNAIYKIDLP
ncbi:hypothetical protein GCM10009120_27180 [Sphingobacterium siyangense subsp. cladoniae]|uniref:hypothetical protein n=1 Tax=Sphingobacterium siyangense TaxID=459529 RepID=UPI0031F8CE71